MTRLLGIALALVCLGAGLSGCGDGKTGSSSGPPEKPKAEGDLAITSITKEAHDSLGIATQPIKTAPTREHLTLTGWVTAKPGYEVTVTAPVAGYVRLAPKRKHSPQQGQDVAPGDALFAIEPVLSPVEDLQMKALQISIDSELTKAKESYDAAKKAYDRAKSLYPKLTTDQDLEKAQVEYRHKDEDLKAAKGKLKLFETPERTLTAPRAGTIVTLHASPGQYVAAAAPLVTIVDLTHHWLRVPVPEHDARHVNTSEAISVTFKGNAAAKGWAGHFSARPVARVPQVDPLRHTEDHFYELSPFSLEAAAEETLRPLLALPESLGLWSPPTRTSFAKDQMLTVYLPLGQERPETVVPYSAIVFDSNGDAWIYLDRGEKDGKRRFERRRVELGPTVGEGVVIRPAIASGSVVTFGAAALFSREFHSTPVK